MDQVALVEKAEISFSAPLPSSNRFLQNGCESITTSFLLFFVYDCKFAQDGILMQFFVALRQTKVLA